jgi:hypothetical protein
MRPFRSGRWLGLLLQEAKDLTQRLQTVVVAEHARQFVDAASKCRACTAPLDTKDTKRIVYRTVFGVDGPSPGSYY